MTEAPLLASDPGEARIDFARPFMAEEFTPLFHTPLHASLPPAVRLRYNQLSALYFNEQVAFFEEAMLRPGLRALLDGPMPPPLRETLTTFLAEEERHTAAFRALNRQCAPELYRERDCFFIPLAPPARWLLGQLVTRPRRFPLLIWLALLQEERSLYYSKGMLAIASRLEPHFVAIHRMHLADEVGHVAWDEQILDWLWPALSPAGRALNTRLFAWMVREFFHLPKRSAQRVFTQLLREFPQLDARALRDAMRALATNRRYRATLYSRTIAPRAFARFAADPQFALLAHALSS
jgi:hypothetical protein